jgi:hypothetical protein
VCLCVCLCELMNECVCVNLQPMSTYRPSVDCPIPRDTYVGQHCPICQVKLEEGNEFMRKGPVEFMK